MSCLAVCAQPRDDRLTPSRTASTPLAVVARPANRQLLDVMEQRGGPQIERSCELRDRPQPWLAASALKQGHLGAVQVARVAERLPRQTHSTSERRRVVSGEERPRTVVAT